MNRRAQIRTAYLDSLQRIALDRAVARGHRPQRKHSGFADIRKWQCAVCGCDIIVQVPRHELYGNIHGVALEYDCFGGEHA